MRALMLLSVMMVCCSNGPGESLCGAGTTFDGEVCVATLANLCGPTTLPINGRCEAKGALATAGDSCGPGTVLQGSQCVPAGAISCGTGTTLLGSQCIATGGSSISCGAGTSLNGSTCVSTVSCPNVVTQASCTTNTQCAFGKTCRDRGDGAKFCMGDGAHGAYCASSLDCEFGGSCRQWSSYFVCMNDGAAGQPCVSSIDCGSSLFCNGSGTMKVCG